MKLSALSLSSMLVSYIPVTCLMYLAVERHLLTTDPLPNLRANIIFAGHMIRIALQ